jgi:phage terminase large subunit-like protein
MPRREKPLSPQEMVSLLTSSLRQTAHTPSIVAYKPLDHQLRFHKSPKKGRAFIGGNRSGKTVGGGTEAVWWLTGKHPHRKIPEGPIRGRIAAVDFLMGVNKIVLPEIKKWIPPSELIKGSWEESYHKAENTLTLANGSTCEFMSYDQDLDKFAGTSRHFCWFDEEPPEDIFNECMLRLVDTDGDWWLTMTPLIDMSWTFDRIYEKWKNKQNLNLEVFEVDTLENTYIKSDVLDNLMEGIAEDEQAARKSGTYSMHMGLVYKDCFTHDNVLEDILESDQLWPVVQSRWGHFLMLDHGYANPTAVLFGAFDHDGRVIIYDEYYQTKKLVHENAEAILARIEELKIRPSYIVGDPSIRNTDPISGGSIHIEYAENGVHISLGNNDVTAGISRVRSRFKNNLLFVTSRCEKTLWELNRYRWDKFSSSKIAQKKNLKETPVKKDDHAMDALRYGIVSRPALSWEVDLPMGNVFNFPETSTNFDRELQIIMGKEEPKVFDDMLGSEW